MKPARPLAELTLQLKKIRKSKGLLPGDLERELMLGPGWIEEFESGKTIPRMDIFFAILNSLGVSFDKLDLKKVEKAGLSRVLKAEERENGLLISFPYGKYDAQYVLAGATLEEFNNVIYTLRDGLALVKGAEIRTSSNGARSKPMP